MDLFCHVFGHIDICGLYLPCTIPLPAQYNIETGKIQEQAMAITSLDILNLSHSLKDVCEVNCKTPECLSQTRRFAGTQRSRPIWNSAGSLAAPMHRRPPHPPLPGRSFAGKEALRNLQPLTKLYQ